MHLERRQWLSKNGKSYASILLRESYREDGKVKKRLLANLTHCPTQQIDAIEWALKNAARIEELASQGAVRLREGKSIGAVWAVLQVAKRLGIASALGRSFQSKLALWQIIARVIEQGSRLSAVRLHETHALADALGLERGFDEDDLYENLAWLAERQGEFEARLFKARKAGGRAAPDLFLYDVTSSYLEGDCNALGAYGYNRDGKRGKKQIVVGLLCDGAGEPISVQVFPGNTSDVKTFGDQIDKVMARFGCERVTFVGDRGMIKSASKEELAEAGMHYISALTKPQIETLLKSGAIQLDLFDEKVCEIERAGVRYILRRNPRRAEEMAASRADKQEAITRFVEKQNAYLAEHSRARIDVALRRIGEKIDRLGCGKWLRAEPGADADAEGGAAGRVARLHVDQAALENASRLDGCYVITTDLPADAADARTIHGRYKDLAQVEQAFRLSKTGHLELRPIYVRSEASTRGHVFVVMLAYLIRRELARAWRELNMTVEEGLDSLKTLCAMRLELGGRAEVLRVPEPRANSRKLLEAAGVKLPAALPRNHARVVTKKKLQKQRLSP